MLLVFPYVALSRSRPRTPQNWITLTSIQIWTHGLSRGRLQKKTGRENTLRESESECPFLPRIPELWAFEHLPMLQGSPKPLRATGRNSRLSRHRWRNPFSGPARHEGPYPWINQGLETDA